MRLAVSLAACALAGCSAIFGIEKLEPFPESEGGQAPEGGGGSHSGGAGGQGGSCLDGDGDGVTDCDGDCDDADALVFPGALEICGDARDNDCDGEADPDSCMGLGTFVSALAGDDDNPGTQAAPLATIAAGVLAATGLANGQPVFVAEGDYAEKVVLVEGVSLLGGYQCGPEGCSWQRDPQTAVSRIINVDIQGVVAGAEITRQTALDGFEVVGLGGSIGANATSSAIHITGGAPTVRNNRVLAAPVVVCPLLAECRSAAVYAEGPSVGPGGSLLEGNIIQGGDAPDVSYGVRANGGASIELAGNDIDNGDALVGFAVLLEGAGATGIIRDNVIHTGDCLAGPTESDRIAGIYMSGNGADYTVDGNRINVDPARVGSCPTCINQVMCAGIQAGGGNATITNNVVWGPLSRRSAGVFINDVGAPFGDVVVHSNTIHGGGVAGEPVSAAIAFEVENGGAHAVGRIHNNILHAGVAQTRYLIYEMNSSGIVHAAALSHNAVSDYSVAYRRYEGSGTNHQTLAAMEAALGVSGNLDAACPLDASFHLEAGAPCIDAGTAGEAPATDFEGDARPQGDGFDIGADERN